MPETNIKDQVRHFYDQVGWLKSSGGIYQNARYEDLRPVSADYIHRCHLRVTPYLNSGGRFLLDAGSGPVQYPEYLTYSENYRYRVCLDISLIALQEARERLGTHGLYVVADAAHLPLASQTIDGLVSLHTLHHLPLEEQRKAYIEFYRVLAPGRNAVVVNGWTESLLMKINQPLVRLMEISGKWISGKRREATTDDPKNAGQAEKKDPTGTYIRKMDSAWLENAIGSAMNYQIRVWRSVNVRFLRAVVHRQLAGKTLLKGLFRLEERFPAFFGKYGQYPMIIIQKPGGK